MLEYWMQVEFYSAIESDSACPWNYFGEYEQPYFTQTPKPGSKHKIKWIDLVFAEPIKKNPKQIVWVELKDIGRSEHTVMANAYGIGIDLAALFTIEPAKTILAAHAIASLSLLPVKYSRNTRSSNAC